MHPAKTVATYYAARAAEYDETAGYTDPAADKRRAPAKARYARLFRDRNVLEIGCGTGYWTSVVAQTARSVTATDVNAEMLAIARERLKGTLRVRLIQADAYALEGLEDRFDAALAVWWWSHMPRDLWPRFITSLHGCLMPEAVVRIADQLPSAYDPQHRRRLGRDTVEERSLRDGSVFTVVKNFPTEGELRALLHGRATDIDYVVWTAEDAWELTYRVRAPDLPT